MNLKRLKIMLFVAGMAAAITAAPAAAQQDVPRMTVETLAGMLDSPDLVIVDARSGQDWNASEFKIQGAVRPDQSQLDSWEAQFGLDKTLVIYCA
jgi:rhodanese-related sulfurtransferase